MKNSFIKTTLLASVMFGVGVLNADIDMHLQFDQAKDSNGDAAPSSTLFFLVADTAGDGFSGESSSIGTGLGNMLAGDDYYYFDGDGGDDLILWRGDGSIMNFDGMFMADPTALNLGNYDGNVWSAGDRLAVVWMPDLNVDSSFTSDGDLFGLFSPDEATSGGDLWITPTDNSNSYWLQAFTEDSIMLPAGPGTGNLSSDTFIANSFIGAAVPEPSTYALVLGFLGMGVFFVRRRLR